MLVIYLPATDRTGILGHHPGVDTLLVELVCRVAPKDSKLLEFKHLGQADDAILHLVIEVVPLGCTINPEVDGERAEEAENETENV